MMNDEEFEARVSEVVRNVLDHPIDIPMGFRSWVTRFIETSDIRIPRSSVTGLYTVGEHVRELGRPVHGRTCMLRVGQSPNYDYVQMTFDEVSNRWVSTQTVHSLYIETMSWGTSSSNWVEVPSSSLTIVPELKAKIESGLVPQVFVSGRLTNASDGGVAYLRGALYEIASGDSSWSSQTVAYGGEVNGSGYRISGWTNMTVSTVTKRHGVLFAQVKKGPPAGSPIISVNDSSVLLRWVADPV